MGDPAETLAPAPMVVADPTQKTWRDFLKPCESARCQILDQNIRDLRESRRDLVARRTEAKSRHDTRHAIQSLTQQIERTDETKRVLMAERALIQNRASSRRLIAVRDKMRT